MARYGIYTEGSPAPWAVTVSPTAGDMADALALAQHKPGTQVIRSIHRAQATVVVTVVDGHPVWPRQPCPPRRVDRAGHLAV